MTRAGRSRITRGAEAEQLFARRSLGRVFAGSKKTWRGVKNRSKHGRETALLLASSPLEYIRGADAGGKCASDLPRVMAVTGKSVLIVRPSL